uniref:(California timema) hypothetical protein n=1 Tax=Timema californicum TaxID=61474 RepID=A0A7R9P8Z7_TIMCA|nr:unnamed protein product [Timema californicum]
MHNALLADLQNTISPPGSGLTSPGSGYGSLNGPRLRENVVSTERYETSPASWSGSTSDLYAIWMDIDTPLATDQIGALNLSSDDRGQTSTLRILYNGVLWHLIASTLWHVMVLQICQIENSVASETTLPRLARQ